MADHPVVLIVLVAAMLAASTSASKCCFKGSTGKQRCMMGDVGCNTCNLAGEVNGSIYVPLGCFRGKPVNHDVYNFRSLSGFRKKWPDFSWLAKLCAEKALAAGYDLFGLEFYGVCRGGSTAEVEDLGWDTFRLEHGSQCWPGKMTTQDYGQELLGLVDQSRCYKTGATADAWDCVGGSAKASFSFVYHIQRRSGVLT